MTPERWDRVWSLFEAALERPAPERAALLDAACTGDPELRAEVERYLRADAAAPSLLDAGPGEPAVGDPALLRVDAPAVVGRAVGPYRVIRELGRGGMGVVYLAERADVQKTVALKLVRGSLASPESGERFLLERRVLARLEHPHVARLLDAGVTDDGLPYFAMEYVDGVPLTDYCDGHRLPVRARLELFGRVCEAVEYAHRNLVVHRDLKPSNILVTEDGTPKLLDFGIAKLLEGDADDGLTGTGMRLMTPEYAAPEQLRGEPVTTATDVYALGVVLYELLSGHRPYQLRGRSPGEVERVVLQTVPPRPSTAASRAEERPKGGEGTERLTPEGVSAARGTSPERLRRQLAGDLDTIVLKALAKEPQERYASARQLLDDTRRHLGGRPVLARPSTAGYRARKFVRRNRWGVVTAAVVVLALVGGAAAATAGFVRATRAEARAREDAATAERVSAFLVGLFKVADPREARGNAVTAREMLDSGATKVEKELSAQPLVQARLMQTMGDAYASLGIYGEASRLLERSRTTRERLLGPSAPELGDNLTALGNLYREQGRYEDADTVGRRGAQILERALGPDDPRVARSLSSLGDLYRRQGRYAEAESLVTRSLRIDERAFGANAEQVADDLSKLAGILAEQGRQAEAEPLFLRVLQMRERAYGPDHPRVGLAVGNLAAAQFEQNKVASAEPLQRRSLAISSKAFGPEHTGVAMDLYNLANIVSARGDRAQALTLYGRAMAIWERRFGPDHPYVAAALNGMSATYFRDERYAESVPLLRRSLAIREKTLAPDHPFIGMSAHNLGFSYGQLGRRAEAEQLMRRALAIREKTLEPSAQHLTDSYRELARLYRDQGRYADAESMYQRAMKQWESAGRPRDPDWIAIMRESAEVMRRRGRTADAAALEAKLGPK